MSRGDMGPLPGGARRLFGAPRAVSESLRGDLQIVNFLFGFYSIRWGDRSRGGARRASSRPRSPSDTPEEAAGLCSGAAVGPLDGLVAPGRVLVGLLSGF